MAREDIHFTLTSDRADRALNMKKNYWLNLAGVFLLSGGFVFGDAAPEFAVEKDKNGVKVFTRKIEGSALKEFKGVTTIKTSLMSLVALMDDTDAYPQWLYNVTSAKLVQKINLKERVTHTVIHAPWPVSDRDTVTYSKIVQDKKSKVVTIYLKGVPNQYPAQAGKVRVPALKGFWQFIPNKNGYVTVIYQVHSEPGGSIPDAIANSTTTDIPYNTLLKMHQIVKQEKYQNGKIPEVEELK